MKTAILSSLVGVFALTIASLQAGNLTPPDGPPQPTMKTLDQVEPGTPITHEDMPFTIISPGYYYLTENIGSGGYASITISTGGSVTLDLKGFTLSGEIEITDRTNAQPGSSTTIRNGHLTDKGIFNYDAHGGDMHTRPLILENLTISKCARALSGVTNLILRNCQLADNEIGIVTGEGTISIQASNSSIKGSAAAIRNETPDRLSITGLTVSDCADTIENTASLSVLELRDCRIELQSPLNIPLLSNLENCHFDVAVDRAIDAGYTMTEGEVFINGCTIINRGDSSNTPALLLSRGTQVTQTKILNFPQAIEAGENLVIDQVQITYNRDDDRGERAISSERGLTLSNSLITGYIEGVYAPDGEASISKCQIISADWGNTGVQVWSNSSVTDCTVRGYETGIEAEQSIVENCRIIGSEHSYNDVGILGYECVMADNAISNYETAIVGDGIQASSNRIINCGLGIRASGHNIIVRQNTIAAQDGIQGYNGIYADNVINVEGGTAIDAHTQGSVIVRNIARGNNPESLFPDLPPMNYSGGTVGPVVYGILDGELADTQPLSIFIDGQAAIIEGNNELPLGSTGISPWANVAKGNDNNW